MFVVLAELHLAARDTDDSPAALEELPGDGGADASDVIGDGEKGRLRIRLRPVVRRDAVGRIVGQELKPLVQLPGIEQRRFVEKKVLDLGACHDRISLSHCTQNARRCASSVLSCSPSFAMPRESGDHCTSLYVPSPVWTDSSASMSSGVAKPPGP